MWAAHTAQWTGWWERQGHSLSHLLFPSPWFFLRKEVQNKWNRKGDSEPMAGKSCKKTRAFCKARSIPCQSSMSAPEEYIDNRNCQERMAQEDQMTSWKAAQSCGVLQPDFSYTQKLQEVSFARYSCKATAFSCWLWRSTRMVRFPGELELPGKWSPMSRCTEGFECCFPF